MSAPPQSRRRRSTAKQRAVLEVLQEQQNFRSAQQLYLDIHRHRQLRIGLTSVYRILRTLADDRIAETQRAEDGEILYRLRTEAGHRHYLVCRQCGTTVEIAGPAIERWAYKVAKEKCDDQGSTAKDVCVKQAEADHARALADAKAGRS